MNLYFELGLIHLLINSKEKPSSEHNPALFNVIHSIGLSATFEEDKETLKKRFFNLLAGLEDRFAYYDASEMKVNWPLNQYLTELFKETSLGVFQSPKNISMMICALGNKHGDAEFDSSIEEWIEEARNHIEQLLAITKDEEVPTIVFTNITYKLEYIEKVLQLLDVFVTSRLGMLGGLEEFGHIDTSHLTDIPEMDFLSGMECNGDEECTCGCTLTHAITTLQGMEDILNGVESSSALYAKGVGYANDIYIDRVSGNEGKVFDAIKNLGQAAYDSISESFNAIKKMITSKLESDNGDDAASTAENAKKSIQAMEDKSVVINDAAAKGIVQLAEQTGGSEDVKPVVSTLKTPSDAPGVIDKLQGLLKKELDGTGILKEAVKKAEEALSNLRKGVADSTKGDEENKDVVASNKQVVTEKIKAAKESLSALKADLKKHTTKVSGIKKTISGIGPKIFSKPGDDK